MVEQASATKASTQLFIEKVEQRYSLGMVVATLLLFAVPLLAGAAFQPTLLRAMTFMIVASPCAVVLATMPPLLAAMANAGRHGVLVKSAVVMEQLGATDPGRVRQDRHPHRGHPAADRDHRPARRRPGRAGTPRPGRGGRGPQRAPAGPRRRRRRPRRRARPSPARTTSPPPRAAASAPWSPAAASRSAARPTCSATSRTPRLPPASRSWKTPGRPPSWCASTGPRSRCSAIADRTRPAAAAAVARITALTGAAPVLLTGDNQRAAARLAGAGRHQRRPRGPAAAGQGRRRQRPPGPGSPGPARRRRRQRRPRAGRRRTPASAMGRAGSDLALDTADAVIVRDDLATVPAVDRPVPPRPPRRHREPGHRRRLITALVDLGPGRAPAAAARRRSATRAPPSSSASTACGCCAPPPGARPSPAAPAHADPGPPAHAGFTRGAAGYGAHAQGMMQQLTAP